MRSFGQNIKYALRILAKSPGFTAIAILTLALGIGANTAIFTVANAVLLRNLPYSHPERLVLIEGSDFTRGGSYGRLSYPFFRVLKDRAQSFSGVAACVYDSFSLTGHGDAEQINGARASPNFFDLLGVRPLAGRTFLPEEDLPGGSNVAVLSYEFATRLFTDPKSAVGKNLSLDSRDYAIIGVLPPDFVFTLLGSRRDVWTTRPYDMGFVTRARVELGGQYFSLLGRLGPGVSREQARAELAVLRDQYRRDKPGNYDASLPLTMDARDFESEMVAGIRPTLLMLSAAVGLVLLIACANVASLLLSRALGRKKEFAVRAALGGSRAALIRQLLTESVILSIASGALGIALGYAGTRILGAMSQGDLKTADLSMDAHVLFFTLAISILSGVIFGLAPSLQLAKIDVNTALRDESRASTGTRGRHHARSVLVIAQVALSMILLVGSGLLIRSFVRLRDAPLGFDPKNVLTMELLLLPSHYGQPAQMTAFYNRVLERLETIPGLDAAALSTALPSSETHGTPVLFEGQPAVALGLRPTIPIQQISPDYAKVLRVPLVAGRMFDDHDDAQSRPVAMVNQTAARKFWPNESAIGKRVWIGSVQNPSEVVGVLGDVRNTGLADPPAPEVFSPYPQLPFPMLFVNVRTPMDPHAVASAVRARIAAVDPGEPVTQVKTMEEHMDSLSAAARFTMFLLGVFAGVALILAVVGIYGVIAYSVAQRTQELGIRMALGAAKGDILRLVIGNGLALTVSGIVIGAAASIALTRLMAGLLYRTSATDPVTFVSSAALFTAVALIASYIPAQRAARIDPTAALRGE